jgi:hypothetical protein
MPARKTKELAVSAEEIRAELKHLGFYDEATAGALLGKSPETLRQYSYTRKGPRFVTLGNHARVYRICDVKDFMHQLAEEAIAKPHQLKAKRGEPELPISEML